LDPPDRFGGGADDRIVLRGIVDETVGAQLGVMLAERVAGGGTVFELDLSEVEAIDEEGLVAIVRVWHEVATCGRSMRFLDPSPAVGPLLDMTGLTATYTER
jgi:anti-anti-sigma regulatory factor